MDQDQRNRFIAQKLNEGLSLGEVQKLLAEQGVTLTYLELRMIAADLKVDWKKQSSKKAPPPKKPAEEEAEDEPPARGGRGRSRTQISVSRVVRPGASMSGDVVFASGAKAEWFVDAYGRLGLNPAKGSAKPTEDDLREFQAELQRKLSGEA
jgi:DNA-binding transcriptional MerR regulator